MNYQEKAQKWLESPIVSAKYKKIIKKATDAELKDMFNGDLQFGTAGIRGIMGPGTNRLNELIIKKCTIGLGLYLNKYCKENSSICISFDNRYNSREYAYLTRDILTDMGYNVYTFRLPHPTPELSFAIRHYKASVGIMITASHNPPMYNGYKVYDEEGGQFVFEKIDRLIDIISQLPNELEVNYEKAPIKGFSRYIDDELDPIFIKTECDVSIGKKIFTNDYRQTGIIFSPMCGANSIIGTKVLTNVGYDVETVPTQDYFDPSFKGTKSPNPEDSIAYDKSIKLFKKLKNQTFKDPFKKFNLILICDPDGDRVGVASENKHGRITLYTGNQTGAMLIYFLFSQYEKLGMLPNNGIMFESFVTSSFGRKIADSFNVEVETVLTGFKYVGYKAGHLKDKKYLFGYEESYGYLVYPFVRDKDSLQSMILIADMVEYNIRKGKTLDVYFDELQRKYGYFLTETYSVKASSFEEFDQMKFKVASMCEKPLKKIYTHNVIKMIDYQNQIIYDFKNDKKETFSNLPKTNCIKYIFEDDGWVSLRPSGTEPKIKIYVELIMKNKPKNKDECLKIYNFLQDFLSE